MKDNDRQDPAPAAMTGDDLIAALIRDAGPREEPPLAHYAEVLAATGEIWASRVAARRRRRITFTIAASIAAAALAVGLTLRFGAEPGPVLVAATDTVVGAVEFRRADAREWRPLAESDHAIMAGTSLRSGDEGSAGLLLEDGTSLRLAVASEIRFVEPGRLRLTAGAVYVDTGSGPSSERRVEVVTPAGRVWDVGTQFEVRYRDDTLTLRVREGRVVLERKDRDYEGLAGEQLRVHEDGRFERAAFSPFDAAWRWVQAVAPLPFDDHITVHELLEWVARETGREVHFAEPGLATRASRTILHGNPRRLLPMEALAVMLETTDLGYTVTADGEILVATRVR